MSIFTQLYTLLYTRSIFSVISKFLYNPVRAFLSLVLPATEKRSPDNEQIDNGKPDPQAGCSEIITYLRIPGSWQRLARPDMHPNCFKIPEPRPGVVVYITKGWLVAWGGNAIVERLPSGDVIKTPIPSPRSEDDYRRNMSIEAQIYQKIYDNFGQHPCIPRVTHWQPETCCLVMEYLENGNLGEYIQNHRGDSSISTQVRHRWAKQAADGLRVLHSIDIIHCDISPRNFLLDGQLNLKISDFGGASISGAKSSAVAETRFLHPNFHWSITPVVGDDLFSLGSLIYFIMTNENPFADVTSDKVKAMYQSRQFPPDTDSLIYGSLIKQCWSREIRTAEDVYNCLESLEKDHLL